MAKQTYKQRVAQLDQLVEDVKAHAIKNYENGWDTLVECHDDKEIREAIGRARTIKGAIRNVDNELGITIYDEHRREIQATAF